MSMKDKSVKIQDWAGNILIIDDYDSLKLSRVIDANRCKNPDCDLDTCKDCQGTGFEGDFFAEWVDEENDNNDLNVYEYIPY